MINILVCKYRIYKVKCEIHKSEQLKARVSINDKQNLARLFINTSLLAPIYSQILI